MQDAHKCKLYCPIQAGAPFPFVSAMGEAVGENSPVRAPLTYSKMQSGIGVARSAYVMRCGFALHELKSGVQVPVGTGATFTWPGTVGNLDTYQLCTASLNGSTAADAYARQMFGHAHFYEVVSPNPNSWPFAGTSRGDWESHIYPHGYYDTTPTTWPHPVLDQNTTAGYYNPTTLYNPAAATLGAVSAIENAHTFTLLTNDNLVFHCQETFTVDWLDAGSAVVATFSVTYDLACDTDDSHFPNYGGAGTVDRMVAGRSISNARFASDFVQGLLWYLYQNNGCNHVAGNPPTYGGQGIYPIAWFDGVDTGSGVVIQAAPFLAVSGMAGVVGNGAFGVWCPPADGNYFRQLADEWTMLGYDLRVPKGTYSLDEYEFDLAGTLIAGPTTTTPATDSWWHSIRCEADGSLKRWFPNIGASMDFARLQGWCPRPPPSGETIPQANATAPDLAF